MSKINIQNILSQALELEVKKWDTGQKVVPSLIPCSIWFYENECLPVYAVMGPKISNLILTTFIVSD